MAVIQTPSTAEGAVHGGYCVPLLIGIAALDFMGFGKKTVAEARAEFAHALQLLNDADSTQSRWETANTYQVLSWCECSHGDVALGEAAKAKALAVADRLASDPGVTTQSIDAFKATVGASLNGTHCVAISPATP